MTLDGGEGYPPGLTALMIAAEERSDQAVSALLELKANVDKISPGGESALSNSFKSEDLEITDKICRHTNIFGGFEAVCKLLSLNRVKITEVLESYIKRAIDEDNAAWICGVENATKYGHHVFVAHLMDSEKRSLSR